MTPSEAHETAWQRDAGHDDMTIACRNIIERTWKTLDVPVSYSKKIRTHQIAGAWCEAFFESERSHHCWFADILVKWECEYENDGKTKLTNTVYGVFEIKPKLFSAGAAFRQKIVQEKRLSAWARDLDPHHASNDYSTFVEIVAAAGDPLIETYVELSRRSILVWDGVKDIQRFGWNPLELSENVHNSKNN